MRISILVLLIAGLFLVGCDGLSASKPEPVTKDSSTGTVNTGKLPKSKGNPTSEVYTDTNDYFTFLPPHGWSRKEHLNDPHEVQFNHPTEKGVFIRVIAEGAPPHMNAGNFMALMRQNEERLRSRLGSQLTRIDLTEGTFMGYPAALAQHSWPGAEQELTLFLSETAFFNIGYVAPDLETLEKHREEVERSLNTILVRNPARPTLPPVSIPLGPAATLTTLDRGENAGSYSSIAIGSDGLPVISYKKRLFNGDLMVSHCLDLICSSATVTNVDSIGNVGDYTTIAIGSDGLPVISYYARDKGDLKLAHCEDPACQNATIILVDSQGDVGAEASMAIGKDGLPVISYADRTNGNLKVVHCGDRACSSATFTTLVRMGAGAGWSSIAIGGDGLPVISYHDSNNQDLKVAHCEDAACRRSTITTVDSEGDVGKYPRLGIGGNGLPVIIYQGRSGSHIALCEDAACNNATTSTMAIRVGPNTSLVIGEDGLPLISYFNVLFKELGVAHCQDPACTSANRTTLDSEGNVGFQTSIAIGRDDLPVISYLDGTNDALKVAHCNNSICTGR